MRPAAFAIPGDINQKTGGYIYERSLLMALRAAGRDVALIPMPASFPVPTAPEMAAAVASLAALPADRPLILDGFISGGIDPAGLDRIAAPLVAMVHHPLGLETGLPPDRAAFLLDREARNLPRMAHVVVPSPHTARILADRFGVASDRITIAPPGFARPDPLRAPVTPPLILSVGLLAARKGHDVLLDALARLTDLDWRACIVGKTHDPAIANALAAQCRALGLTDRVTFAGEMDTADLCCAYRAASVFALATRYEGYGMVFSEAMSHGLPVVSCAVGAVPDTVPADTGLLVPPDDPAAFAAALRLLLSNPVRREALAAAALARAETLPDWADTAAIMGAVLDRV